MRREKKLQIQQNLQLTRSYVIMITYSKNVKRAIYGRHEHEQSAFLMAFNY